MNYKVGLYKEMPEMKTCLCFKKALPNSFGGGKLRNVFLNVRVCLRHLVERVNFPLTLVMWNVRYT